MNRHGYVQTTWYFLVKSNRQKTNPWTKKSVKRAEILRFRPWLDLTFIQYRQYQALAKQIEMTFFMFWSGFYVNVVSKPTSGPLFPLFSTFFLNIILCFTFGLGKMNYYSNISKTN